MESQRERKRESGWAREIENEREKGACERDRYNERDEVKKQD